MQEIRTEIEISVSPSKVWDILTDFDQWKEWNPTVNKSTGEAVLGAKLNLTMRGKNGKDANSYSPVITILEKPKLLRWRAKMIAEFLFTNEKIVELEEIASGTRLIHRELFGGLLVPLFWSKMQEGVSPILNSLNDALKELAEKNSGKNTEKKL